LKQRIRYLIPAILLACVLLTTLVTISAASANNIHFHYWGRAYVLGDNSTVLPNTLCDTGSILPLSGGNVETSLCFLPTTPTTNFGNSLTIGNLAFDPTQPSGLSNCTPALVLSTNMPCTFYQLFLQISGGNASVITQSSEGKASTTAIAKAAGLVLNIYSTTITPPVAPATQPTSTTAFVLTVLEASELDSVSVAECTTHKDERPTLNAAAETSAPSNDLRIFENGSLHGLTPDGTVDQSVVINTTTTFVAASAILNEQHVFHLGSVAAIRTNGLHIIATDQNGQVLIDFTVDTTLASIHCAHHLPEFESPPPV
jgi:hypothetical protein